MSIAIITGASSGLGYEYAKLLDQRGLDQIFLIARNEERLKALSHELKTPSIILPLDLTQRDPFIKLQEYLKPHHKIKYLINSAGFGYIGKAYEIDDHIAESMIMLHELAVVRMINLTLPFMEKDSFILNISSCAGLLPLPNLSLYAATKAFLVSYSLSLSQELKTKGISVSAICPYWIKDTDFVLEQSKNRKENNQKPLLILPTYKKSVATKSLKLALKGRRIITPDWISTIIRYAALVLPNWLIMWISNKFTDES